MYYITKNKKVKAVVKNSLTHFEVMWRAEIDKSFFLCYNNLNVNFSS